MPRKQNLTGKVFGRLTVIKEDDKRAGKKSTGFASANVASYAHLQLRLSIAGTLKVVGV